MQDLTQSDIQSILKFIQKIYSPCSHKDFPARILESLSKVISSDIIFWKSFNLRRKLLLSTQTFPSLPSSEIERIQQVAHKNFYTHPIIRNFAETGNCEARTISNFLSLSQLHGKVGLYHQFLRLINAEDQLGIFLPIASTSMTKSQPHRVEEINYVAFCRSQRNFSERDQLILNILGDHILQAYQIAIVSTHMEQKITQFYQTLNQANAIILTIDGQVQLMTEGASRLLTQYFEYTFHQVGCLPEDLQRWVKYQIFLISEIHSPLLPMIMEKEGKQLIIRFSCDYLQGQHWLFLQEKKIPCLTVELLELLGITRREAEVLLWVAKDKSNIEIGEILSCSNRTVNKHLEHIYQKLGVKTRIAAVMTALRSSGILNQ